MVRTNEALSLALARAGQRMRIDSFDREDSQVHRLRELGLLEGRSITVLSNTNPLLCQVGQSRLGLCRRLAGNVRVSPILD